MTTTWGEGQEITPPRPTALGWLLVLVRGVTLGVVVFGGLLILLALRFIERPLCGAHRPVTPYITQIVCRTAFIILGIRYRVQGTPMRQRGAIVANHASWLDIFALNARKRIYFVSKAEVAKWPGIGWLARATGTVFINRDRKEAAAQKAMFEERLTIGHKLLFFPEGTSTDGRRVLTFKPTLFAAFFADELRDFLHVQPVTLVYRAPKGADARFYGWWGDMEFGAHMLAVLAAPRQGSVTLIYHEPISVAAAGDRKALAAACQAAVLSGLPEEVRAND
ncbi:lysophospholipid acyltransferase family protein [Rhodovulum sp. FJ3]|uniref:lysophospholipid acyltransferase family protein n=1 Tax=Rhodovulum sp. FJ3 TaxID=3079053 RepID=UPI00293DFAB7|nr:lysophospholipid acyltransferase family protein [Rhodovulum sp. FJ3]MDV4168098.1 lysophospholipid acyltransferase family protein [Rhodovulum sp. FJ3]